MTLLPSVHIRHMHVAWTHMQPCHSYKYFFNVNWVKMHAALTGAWVWIPVLALGNQSHPWLWLWAVTATYACTQLKNKAFLKFCFQDKFSPCCPGFPGTHSVDQLASNSRSVCLCLSNAGIKALCNYTCFFFLLFFVFVSLSFFFFLANPL